MEDAPKKFFRLKPGGEVRLRFAGIIKCDEVVKDAAGRVTELRCTFDPDHSRKVKGTIHWVSRRQAPRRRGAAVRPPVQRRKPRRTAARRGDGHVPRQPQSRVARSAQGREARTVAAPAQSRRAIPVRARRLLLRRPGRLEAGQARVQPHGDAARQLDERSGQRTADELQTDLPDNVETTLRPSLWMLLLLASVQLGGCRR